MSTPNFKLPKTKKHYVINTVDEFEYDSIIDTIQAELEGITAKGLYGKRSDEWLSKWADERAIYAYTMEVFDHYYKQWEEATLYVTVENGYYEGSIFDISSDDLDSMELSKTTIDRIERLKSRIEKVLAGNTIQIRRVAVFSNGEAIYELDKEARA